jgi:heat shock protein HslJ
MKELKDMHKNLYCTQIITLLLVAGISSASCSSTKEGPSADRVSKPEFRAVLKQPDFGEVIGREWVLFQIQALAGPGKFSRAVLEVQGMGDYYTLRFNKERLTGKGAPNRYTAHYQLGEWTSISIQAIAGTLIAALREPPGLQEREYYGYLERVSRWSLEKGTLNLYTRNSSGESLVLVYQLRRE